MSPAPTARDTDEVIDLVTHAAAPQQQWIAGAVGICLVGTALLALPFARSSWPVVPAFLPAFLVANLVTFSLLTSQFRVSRAPALVALATTYLFVGLITIPQVMTFPGVAITPGPPAVAASNSFWFWVWGHVAFPIGVFAFLITGRLWGHLRPTRAQLNALTLLPIVIVLPLVGGLTAIVLHPPAWLPTIIRQDDYTALITSGVGPVVWGLNAAVFIALLVTWQRRTIGHLWLTVATLAVLMDVSLTFLGSHRYSAGWYLGEWDSFLGAGVVFVAFLFETHRHYDRVVGQGRELRAIFDSSPVGIARMDLEGRTLETNHALRIMLSYNDEELHTVPLDALMPAAEAMRDCEYRVELLTGNRDHYDLETQLIPKVGAAFWGQIHVSLVRGRRGEPLYFVAMLQDVSERKRHEESITWQAYHDPLTRLPNRLAIDECLAQTNPDDVRTRLGVIYLDLNGFKQVNDTLGHDAGDDVLREVARRLTTCVRVGDLAARIGGDEFVLLMPGLLPQDDVEIVVTRVHAVLAHPIVVHDRSVTISASVGVSIFPDNGTDLSSLVAQADAAMYRIKTIDREPRSAFPLKEAAD